MPTLNQYDGTVEHKRTKRTVDAARAVLHAFLPRVGDRELHGLQHQKPKIDLAHQARGDRAVEHGEEGRARAHGGDAHHADLSPKKDFATRCASRFQKYMK
jgi:hypothetical protein